MENNKDDLANNLPQKTSQSPAGLRKLEATLITKYHERNYSKITAYQTATHTFFLHSIRSPAA
jgi:hypothetical protein